MLRDMFTQLQKDLKLEDENIIFDWISQKKRLIERRAAAEEAEKRAKDSQKASKIKGKFAKSMMTKIAAIEEAERKRA